MIQEVKQPMITQDQIQQIKDRAEAATAGPWEFRENEFNMDGDNGDHIGAIRSLDWWIAAIDDAGWDEDAKANATFIAAARSDIPALIAHIEALQAEVADLDKALGECRRRL